MTKVLMSMARCMRRDPRRRFVLGYTVEDAHMRLWFLDRTQIVVSTPFNFLTVSMQLRRHYGMLISCDDVHRIISLSLILCYQSAMPEMLTLDGIPL